MQIGLGDRLGIEQRIGPIGVLDAAGAEDSAVDDEMGDMDPVRRELARQALSEPAQREFAIANGDDFA